MTKELKITEFAGNILYIENAFPLHKEFLNAISDENIDEDILDIIPKWSKWVDGYPVSLSDEDPTKWEHRFLDTEEQHRGIAKNINWDLKINGDNAFWPRIEVTEEYDEQHKKAYEILKMIDIPYKEMLKIWQEKFNELDLEYITKNYCIRNYRTGASMGIHVDRNVKNPNNNMDWTALIYLNDNYSGGEVVFNDLDLELKPSAGSILFFPCLARHYVKEITEGNKQYVFLFLHTEYGLSTSLGEPYQTLTDGTKIKNKKNA